MCELVNHQDVFEFKDAKYKLTNTNVTVIVEITYLGSNS